eukprot:3807957-Prymnesium_polylepis.1
MAASTDPPSSSAVAAARACADDDGAGTSIGAELSHLTNENRALRAELESWSARLEENERRAAALQAMVSAGIAHSEMTTPDNRASAIGAASLSPNDGARGTKKQN